MATAIAALNTYSDSSDDEKEKQEPEEPIEQPHTIDPKDVGKHLSTSNSIVRAIAAAPDVVAGNDAFKYGLKDDGTIDADQLTVDPNSQLITFNANYSQLFKQASGPARPRGEKMIKNSATGYLQTSAVNEAIFEDQRRQFAQFQKLEAKTAKQIN